MAIAVVFAALWGFVAGNTATVQNPELHKFTKHQIETYDSTGKNGVVKH